MNDKCRFEQTNNDYHELFHTKEKDAAENMNQLFERIRQEAFMDGYKYAIQLLKESIVSK